MVKMDGKAPTGLGVVMLWPEKGAKKRQAKCCRAGLMMAITTG